MREVDANGRWKSLDGDLTPTGSCPGSMDSSSVCPEPQRPRIAGHRAHVSRPVRPSQDWGTTAHCMRCQPAVPPLCSHPTKPLMGPASL